MDKTLEILEFKVKSWQEKADTLQEIVDWTARQYRLIRAMHSENQDSYYNPQCNECVSAYPCAIIKILDNVI